MTSSPKGTALTTSALSSTRRGYVDRFTRRGFNPTCPLQEGPSAGNTLRRSDRPLVVSAKKPPRILLVDAALALCEVHLVSLRLIPAIVEKLASCADMYLHEENAYALVILVLHPNSRETAEVAHFVRHRWSASRILLLESESAVIDDRLYDERVDPHSHPAIVCEAAIRLMTEEKCRMSPLHKSNLNARSPMSTISGPENIADAFVDLTGASPVTGKVVHVDDGAQVGRW